MELRGAKEVHIKRDLRSLGELNANFWKDIIMISG